MRLWPVAGVFLAASLLPYVARRFDARLSARVQSTIHATALVGLSVATVAMLLAIVAPEAFEAENLVEVFQSCVGAVGALLSHPGAHLPAVLAATALVLIVLRGLLAATVRVVAASRGARLARHIEDHHAARLLPPDAAGVITTGDDEALAFVTGVVRPVVVVSRGLLERLHPDEREAVLAHEQAHRRLRHHLFLICAEATARALAPVPSARAAFLGFRRGLEARADDVAAATTGREAIAAAIGSVALGPGFAGSVGLGESDTLWRARRLLQPASQRRLLGIGVLAGGFAVVALAVRLALARGSGLVVALSHAGHHCHVA